MRSALQTTMINDFENDETFKEIYLFSFNFAKPPNQKSLPLETAIAFWELLLNGKYKHLDLWTTYLQVILSSLMHVINAKYR